MAKCKAKRYMYEWACAECSLRWDIDDPEPPKCRPKTDARFEEPAPKSITEIKEKLYEQLNNK